MHTIPMEVKTTIETVLSNSAQSQLDTVRQYPSGETCKIQNLILLLFCTNAIIR